MKEGFEKFIFYTALETDDGQKNCCRQKGKYQALSKSAKGITSAGREFFQEYPRNSQKYKENQKNNIYFSWEEFQFH
ncbi:hypothetical protein MUP35_01960 [Patescibacteria group bacterium]|nr:hypothetical protein [Patescibacteria group bacterium]